MRPGLRGGLTLLLLLAAAGLLWWLAPAVLEALADLRRLAEASARAVQRDLAGAVRGLATGQPGALMGLLALCFGYGLFHAAGPGHGKLLIGGYGLARDVPMARLIGLALASSLAQASMAVGLVLILVLAFGWARASVEGLAEALFLPVSHGVIAVLGLWLVWRGMRGWRAMRRARAAGPIRLPGQGAWDHAPGCACGQAHGPTPAQIAAVNTGREALTLIVAIALRPCSGALFLLIVTWQMGILPAGIAGVYAMGLGTALVTVLVALLVGGSRIGAMALLPAGLGATLARGLPLAELVAGLLILALAVPLLWNSL